MVVGFQSGLLLKAPSFKLMASGIDLGQLVNVEFDLRRVCATGHLCLL